MTKSRELDWKYADLIWGDRERRPTLPLAGISHPADLHRAGYCVVAERGFLRVCVKDGWYWVVGIDTAGPAPACIAVRSDVRYMGDTDTIVEPERACEHEWHCGGTVNGRRVYDCQICGKTRYED